jgi:tripartite-type tricarboxylate transporter receptor subunit TctC
MIIPNLNDSVTISVNAFSELGYPVLFSFWYGLVVPKGTPEEVVRTINTACKKVVDDHKDFIEDRLGKMSLKLAFLKTEEFAEEVKVQNEALKKIFKDLMKFNK